MNISTKLKDEELNPDKPSKGYEWWYFDALSSDKQWGIVIIFYQGNPFSPKYIKANNALPSEFPAISVSIYKNGKTEFYSFLEYGKDTFKWNVEDCTASIGSNFFKRTDSEEGINYELLLAQTLDSGHYINTKLKFKSSRISEDLIEHESANEQHYWNLIQPVAQVSGSITINGKSKQQNISFFGNGYHDHNIGFEPMKDSFKDWYWGRFHFKESTLIYYVMNSLDGAQQYEAWLISNDGKEVVVKFDEIRLLDDSKNLFGLQVARKIELSAQGTKVSIQQRDLIDNGPFYQRYLSEAIIHHNSETEAITGISEYIKPEKIYEEKYWWMVRMRLRFLNRKPHWVQRFKMFYEWTW